MTMTSTMEMAGRRLRIDRLRRLMKKHQPTTKEDVEHCPPTPDIIPVSVEHHDDANNPRELTTTPEGGFNAADVTNITSNSEGFNAAAADIASATATLISYEEGKRLFQQQYHDVRNKLISPTQETEVSRSRASPMSMPFITHSTVNHFEPSVVGDAHTFACDKMNHSSPKQCPKETNKCKSTKSFDVNEISLVDMDDVSEIENPDLIGGEDENYVCLQVLNESLLRPNTTTQSDQMDNDIISLPYLTVVTPEDGEKTRGRNNESERSSSHRHRLQCNYADENLQSYIGDYCNDIVQALSNNMNGCGLNETYVALDEIRSALFQ